MAELEVPLLVEVPLVAKAVLVVLVVLVVLGAPCARLEVEVEEAPLVG